MPFSTGCPARRRRAAAWALAALTVSGCSSGRPNSLPEVRPGVPVRPMPAECVIGGDSAAGSMPVVVAAALPADSELVARQELSPPVLLDCAGTPRPGAASSWSADSSATSWTLVLAEAAPDAGAVATAWRDSAAAATLRFAGVQSVIPLDPRRLVLTFDRRFGAVPPVLADAALAVPLESVESALTLADTAAIDPRDALDGGADLLRTADPAVLDYARSDSGFMVVPLPWSRTYVLLQPAAGALGSGATADSAGLGAASARDAVPGEARSAQPPFWWETRAECGAGRPPGHRPAPMADEVAYARDDAAARALAGRIVALSDRPGLIARGLPPAELNAALVAGAARGFVLALPRPGLVPCRETALWPAGAVVAPLVDTRASAVVRRGIRPLAVEYDGTLRPLETP